MSARVASQQEKVVGLQSSLEERRRAEEGWEAEREAMSRELQIALKVELDFLISHKNGNFIFLMQDRSDRQKSLLEELAAADEEGLKEKALSLENR